LSLSWSRTPRFHERKRGVWAGGRYRVRTS